MKHKYEKNIRILNDLMGYCHFLGGNRFHVDFQLHPTSASIRVECRVPGVSSQVLKEMRKILLMPRQREVEQNFWNISGEEEIDAELSLVGMMVDNAEVEYDGETLVITVERIDQTPEE